MINRNQSIHSYHASRMPELAIIHYDKFSDPAGHAILLPQRVSTQYASQQRTFGMIEGSDVSGKVSSIFATGLMSCSAFIYIYPQNENEGIDHIALYHSPSTTLPADRGPLSPIFNTKNTSADNVKVVIGTPNEEGDEGIEKVLAKLEEMGIQPENIFVYYGCDQSFGIDSYGNIGELGVSLNSYAQGILTKTFVECMRAAIDTTEQEKAKSFFKASEFDLAKGFIKKLSKEGSSKKDFEKIVEKYFSHKSSKSQHPIRMNFLANLSKVLNLVAPTLDCELLPDVPNANHIRNFLNVISQKIRDEANLNLELLKEDPYQMLMQPKRMAG